MTTVRPRQAGARFDPATLEILWSRLHGINEEMWNTILRTSFSTIIGAALDYGVALLDARGDQLAHAAGSMPLFNLALPTLGRDLLRRYEGRIGPGDIFIGNDPWLCCGHLPDVAIMTPVFRDGRLVAFATNVAHQADFGGAHGHKRVREVYEEGLFLPVMKLYEQGRRNATLFEIIEANVRTPEMVLGDIQAQVAANEVGTRRLLGLMDEYGLADLTELVAEIQGRSERAMRAAIKDLPNGTYRAETFADGDTEQLRICVAITIQDDEVVVDYAGTDPQVGFGGVNCTLSYTTADTHYALKAVLAPNIPHNEGSTRPLTVRAPTGSLLNATFPAAVNMRTHVGWRLYAALFGALAQVVPDRVTAAPGLLQTVRVVGWYPDGRGYNAPIFAGGGRGASSTVDGIGGYIFPSSASTVSVEVFEASCPALVLHKEWLPDTAGAGRFRGGPAQHIAVRRLPGYDGPVRIRFAAIRRVTPAQGFFGGRDGTLSHATWNGEPVTPDTVLGRDGWTSFRTDEDELSFFVPSGGGFGEPIERDRTAIERDIALGFVTPEGAARDYGA
jgi:N-methylhydantoinase B/oxoprolinase/acetone carboxylase alpha subunit